MILDGTTGVMILDGTTGMRSFLMACIAAVVIAAVAAVALSFLQEPVDVAFTTSGVRL
jgi:hypothetical protein